MELGKAVIIKIKNFQYIQRNNNICLKSKINYGEIMGLDKIDIYYDHYKETCNLSKQTQNRRNKFFVWLCILEAVSFMFLLKPDETVEIFSDGINAHFKTNIVFGNSVLQTLLWIVIAYITVRYCQDTLYVRRLYPYVDKLEKEIIKTSKVVLFEREGQGYLKEYPMVLNFIDLFYKMFCPILFLGINIVHIIREWQGSAASIALVCDTVIFGEIFLITWFYFFEIHSKLSNWCKIHIPFIGCIDNKLRKILKEV